MHSTESVPDFLGLRNGLYTQGTYDISKEPMTFIIVAVYSLSCVRLFCDSMDSSPPSSCPWDFPR